MQDLESLFERIEINLTNTKENLIFNFEQIETNVKSLKLDKYLAYLNESRQEFCSEVKNVQPNAKRESI